MHSGNNSSRPLSLATLSLLWAGDVVSRQHVMKYLKFYSESQWWSREELERYQERKLRELLLTVDRDVPFYRDLYRRRNVDVSKLKTLGDLEYLPVVTKQDFRAAAKGHCLRKTGLPEKTYYTSGSTGSPFAVRVDSLSMSQARALMILRARYSGWSIGEPVFQTGMSLNRGIVKRIKDIVFRVYYASAYDLSDEKLDLYLDVIDRKKIMFLMGYPGSIFALAERAGQVGFNLGMRGIVTWGDNLYDHFRKTIEKQFKCRVTDTYGCGEGIQVAAQCPERGRYHVFMPHVIVEVVDDDGVPVERGQLGNILLTRLEPGAMPFVRYKVGDVGRMSRVVQCECGRGLDSLEAIDGRVSDFIYTPGGNRLIVHFFTGILEYYPEIREFQVVQKEVEKITINIVPSRDFDERILDEIRREINMKGDPDLSVEFDIVHQINIPETGKRKFVISEL